MKRLFCLVLAPVCLFSQEIEARRNRVAEPAVEFTTTTNASEVGTDFVIGYQFTVRSPVILTSLGAVLQANSVRPVFGTLPVTMQVGLWDEAENLVVSATVSTADPQEGHFNYKQVTETLLVPGVSYVVASLVPPGLSVLSDVPAMVPGSLVVYGGSKSLASKTLTYPTGGDFALRKSYFGASFTYMVGISPVARPGQDRSANVGDVVKLDGSGSFSGSGGSLRSRWALVSVPQGSGAAFSAADSTTPSFVPDREGVYVAQLIVTEGSTPSVPSTVSVIVAAPAAIN